MRIVLLLVVLTIIGLISSQWIGGKPPAPPAPLPASASSAPATVPAIPARPQDLRQFEQDLNRFMQDAAAKPDRQDHTR